MVILYIFTLYNITLQNPVVHISLYYIIIQNYKISKSEFFILLLYWENRNNLFFDFYYYYYQYHITKFTVEMLTPIYFVN